MKKIEAIIKPFKLDDVREALSAAGIGYRHDRRLGTPPEGWSEMEATHSFDGDNPPYPGWAGWLSGVSELRRYHEVPRWRTIWRHIEVPGVPAGMLNLDG